LQVKRTILTFAAKKKLNSISAHETDNDSKQLVVAPHEIEIVAGLRSHAVNKKIEAKKARRKRDGPLFFYHFFRLTLPSPL